MKVFATFLYRKFCCPFLHHGHLGMNSARDLVGNPYHRLLRQHCYYKAGLVTAADLVSYWQNEFVMNKIPEAQESSEYIVSHVLGAKTFQNLSSVSVSAPLSAQQLEQVEHLCAKRLQRMPVQYILGEWDFQDLTLKMEPPVFIPRPETEELVAFAVDEECRKSLNSAGGWDPWPPPQSRGPVVLEVGCGSGAIALSILNKLPQSRVIAIDKSEAAVNLTKENAERLNLQDRISVLHHDVCSGSMECLLPCSLIDTVISNPPYIFHEDMIHLAAEILSYEDHDALDGGDDGMTVIKEIMKLASYVLKDFGSVFLEVDPRHPEMVNNWLCNHPDLLLFLLDTHKDVCGKPRFLHIQKHEKKYRRES